MKGYCTECIHYKVCGNEGVDDSAMTFCVDKQTDGDLISRQAVLDIFGDIHPLDYNARAYVTQIKELPSAEKTAEVRTMQVELEEEFEREIEIANKDIDFAEGTDESEENYMRGYLGGILCAYRIVFGKNYEEKTE